MKDLRERLFVATFSKDAIDVIRDYKLNIEINDTCISQMLDKENFADLRKAVRGEILDSESERVIFHGPFTEIHPAAIDHRIVEAGRVRLEEAYEIMRHVGAKDMVVHSGYVPFIYMPSWQVEKSIEFWKNFMAGKPKDFHIYIENVLEEDPEMLKEIIKGIDDPRVKICLDVGHANAMSESTDVYRWVEILGNDIGHFHLHNNDGTGDDHQEFGDGSIDFEKLFDVIETNCSDDVTFTIETRDCRSSAQWLREKGLI